ncbi:hypothetical protein F5B17DRAFT_281147 [Nemania serpens]|nr:hypothetical protein F5B17DRAFT_281147 [Nemania serpens]
MSAQEQRQKEEQQPPRVFHLFRQLPTELRLEIWTHTWEPRIVSIFPIVDTEPLRYPASGYVNFESRSETLRYYKRCFAYPHKSDFRLFNFRLDTLCVTTKFEDIMHKLDPVEASQVQRLIFPDCVVAEAFTMVPCARWPEPLNESFESPTIERRLKEKYPSLREVTLTSSWYGYKLDVHDSRGRPYHAFSSRDNNNWVRWDDMKTACLGGLKVRYCPPLWSQPYHKGHCYRLSKGDVRLLKQSIKALLFSSRRPPLVLFPPIAAAFSSQAAAL